MASRRRGGSRRSLDSTVSEMTQSVRSTGDETNRLCESKIVELVKYITCHATSGIPIKYHDLASIVNGGRELNKYLPEIKKILMDVYGLILIEMDKVKKFICIAEEPSSLNQMTDVQQSEQTLLYIVLTYIFIRGGKIEESKLYNVLETMGIDVNIPHKYFGNNIKKTIEDSFVKRAYLKREVGKKSSFESTKYVYEWGFRAQKEFSYQDIANSMAKLSNKPASFFEHQLKLATGLEDPKLMAKVKKAMENNEMQKLFKTTNSYTPPVDLDPQMYTELFGEGESFDPRFPSDFASPNSHAGKTPITMSGSSTPVEEARKRSRKRKS